MKKDKKYWGWEEKQGTQHEMSSNLSETKSTSSFSEMSLSDSLSGGHKKETDGNYKHRFKRSLSIFLVSKKLENSLLRCSEQQTCFKRQLLCMSKCLWYSTEAQINDQRTGFRHS